MGLSALVGKIAEEKETPRIRKVRQYIAEHDDVYWHDKVVTLGKEMEKYKGKPDEGYQNKLAAMEFERDETIYYAYCGILKEPERIDELLNALKKDIVRQDAEIKKWKERQVKLDI